MMADKCLQYLIGLWFLRDLAFGYEHVLGFGYGLARDGFRDGSVCGAGSCRCELFEEPLVASVGHSGEGFGAPVVVFVNRHEATQHLFLSGRKWRAVREGEQCRQIKRDGHKPAHASRPPCLIDNSLACIATQRARDVELLRFVERQKVDSRAIDRNIERLFARRDY